MINNREKGKLRLSLKKEETLGRIDTTITGREGIMQSSQGQITIKWSALYSESQCIKYWKKVKNESFFKWPNKMVGNPEKRNRNLYCQYHRDHGHTTEDCKSLWDHLDQLV